MIRNTNETERLRAATRIIREMRTRLEASESRDREPIAIVGTACRFPGGATSPDAFWSMLTEGRDAIGPIPADRWDADAYYDPSPDAYWKMYNRRGSFLQQPIDAFDAEFFGISPREALSLDPQQRLLLEVAWEALENAGIPADSLAGSDTGSYIGMITGDYGHIPYTDIEPKDLPYFGTGNAISFPAGRISYVLGLQGPCMVIGTACSSTLVSTHLACHALRRRECDLALTGGVSLMIHPDTSIILSQMRATAPDGTSKVFDEAADGFGRGEGCGILVLKRLEDAQRDNDRVLAVIRGSAVNHDGASGGITVPNGPAQEKVLRKSLASAGLEPADIDFVEAHGTGTSLGDPIELLALGNVFGLGRLPENPLLIGSVKTNVGHLEAAAGVAGLLKVVVSLQNEELPPHLHLDNPTSRVPWDELPLRVVREGTPWPRGDVPRRAAVSAFGLSGVNANVILEEAPTESPVNASLAPAPAEQLLHLSAKTLPALRELAERFRERLHDPCWQASLADICFTADSGRSRLRYRRAFVAKTRQELSAVLEPLALGKEPSPPQPVTGKRSKIAFLFSGQGSQSLGMGRDLFDSEPVFRAVMEQCADLLQNELERPLLSVIYSSDPDDRDIHNTAYTQPALFAIEMALTALWKSWGIEPDMVLGHSVGEFAAAVVSGVFELEPALRLVTARGRLMASLPQNGAMAVVGIGEAQVRAALAGHAADVSIAAVNGPANVVVSGREAAVHAVCGALEEQGARITLLTVSHAFHSPLMDPIVDAFAEEAQATPYQRPDIPIVSSVHGEIADANIADPGYWCRQIREPVRFEQGMRRLVAEGIDTFIEIGPRPTLLGMGINCVPNSDVRWISSLHPKHGAREHMLRSAGTLFEAGMPVKVLTPEGVQPPRKVVLPNYPFQRKSYWVPLKNDHGPAMRPSHLPGADIVHPLLGRQVPVAGQTRVYEVSLHAESPSYLADHRVYGTPILPGTGFLEMAQAALLLEDSTTDLNTAPIQITDVEFRRPLVLDGPEGTGTLVQIHLYLGESDNRWEIYSAVSDADTIGHSWSLHAIGRASRLSQSSVPKTDLVRLRDSCALDVSVPDFYEAIASRGIEYGDSFQGVQQLWRGDGEALGVVELPACLVEEAASYVLHPALLDACFQVVGAVIPPPDESLVYLPVGLESLVVYQRPAARHYVHATLSSDAAPGAAVLSAGFRILDEHGQVVAELQELRFQRAPRAALMPARKQEWMQWLLETCWREVDGVKVNADVHQRSENWLVNGDDDLSYQLATRLEQDGHRVFRSIELDTKDPESALRLIRRVVAESGSIDGIVCLGQIAATSSSVDWQAACGAVLHLVQATVQEALAGTPRLFLVTHESMPVGAQSRVPGWANSALWGLGKVVAREHPEFECRLIDVGPKVGAVVEPQALELLYQELHGADSEPLVALGSRRLAPRIRRYRPRERSAAAPIRADASYIVVGGLGGLGLATAELLVAKGAGRLVLVGRSVPSPALVEKLDALGMHGTKIETVRKDISSRQDVSDLVAFADQDSLPLRGIFQSAGYIDDGILLNQDLQRFARVFSPKVDGTWNLHLETKDLPLEHFVMFSSAAALLGNQGQANYVAANAFLDGLAHHRRSLGLPALSVAWGAWETRGATDTEVVQKQLSRRGVQALTKEQGIAALDFLLGQDVTNVAVLPLNLEGLGTAAQHPLLSELAPEAKNVGAGNALRAALSDAQPSQWRPLLMAHLQSRVTAILGLPSNEKVDPQVGFFDLGMDSLMTVELRNQLQADLDTSLPSTLALEHPTIDAMTERLLITVAEGQQEPLAGELEGGRELARPLETVANDDVNSILASIEAMSEDEVHSSLHDAVRGKNNE